jgi:hypothetical protein
LKTSAARILASVPFTNGIVEQHLITHGKLEKRIVNIHTNCTLIICWNWCHSTFEIGMVASQDISHIANEKDKKVSQ